MAGRDPAGEHIGPAAAYRSGLGMNWYPVDTFKHTLCGSAHQFNIHDPMGDEFDFNHFIIPNSVHAFILEDVKLIADPDDVVDCASTDDCVEVEITPPGAFFWNPWFYPDSASGGGYSVFEGGSPLCTYGPWVWEEAHGNRPEIHPSELYWWSRLVGGVPGGPRRYHLMLLQEDSNRFDRQENFAVSDPPPGWWRPWSAFPRTGEFKIAFELDPSESPLNFGIREVEPWNKNVVTARDYFAFEDADDGRDHAIEYNGKIVLTAKEMQQRDDDIGVRFVDVCRNATDTRMQGYISITSKVGTSDRGGEGYHVIRVGPENDPIDPTPDAAPNGPPNEPEMPQGTARKILRAKVIENSLRRDVSGGRPQLLVDIEVRMESNSDLRSPELTVSEAYLLAKDGRRKRLEFFQGPQVRRVRVQNVPMASVEATHIEFKMQSGDRRLLALPEISLAPAIALERLQHSTTDTSAWNGMVKAAGGQVIPSMPTPQLLKVSQWELEVTPGYAPVRMGTISREDDSPIAEKLNEVLRRGGAEQLEQLFGSSQPFAVEWSFVATNLTTGANVPVKVDQTAEETEIRVELLSGKVPKGRIKIWFPEQPANHIYELTATERMTDAFGGTGDIQHRLWSHVFTNETADGLVEVALSVVAAEAGMPANELKEASSLEVQPDDRRPRDARFRQARMVRLLARRTAQDMHINVGELRSLIRTAKLLKGR
ncbi:MAG: hypothetical protein L0Z46_02170 [Nitrospiraceae bacterium]|nr:hypothetical protein [Nitrospiraceae bacterium]